jgi:hypothetical protein
LAQRWDHFFVELKKAHIRLNNSSDELIWALNGAGGNYTPILGYSTHFGPGPGDDNWRWQKLWKVKVPPKCKLFMWLILNNKFLTWEALHK